MADSCVTVSGFRLAELSGTTVGSLEAERRAGPSEDSESHALSENELVSAELTLRDCLCDELLSVRAEGGTCFDLIEVVSEGWGRRS